jgi:hypothetical protein
MTTHATESRAATQTPISSLRLPGITPAPIPLDRDVRVKFESLPVPLRVSARDRSETAILIEGDLPWLAVGTALNLELPDGVHQAGRVHSFDIDVTPPGSARLRIFAELSPPGCPPPPATAAGEDPELAAPRQAAPSRLVPLLFLFGASLGGYVGWDPSPLRSLLDSGITVIGGLLRGV